MSAFVAIVHLDGAPVDRELLERMTRTLAARGPDAREIWVDGAVGLGHALLRTTCESAHERQPLTLDGRTWIAADCRVDGRADLIGELAARGSTPSVDVPDPELILRAYTVWGERCLDHLLGDFTFAVWDAPRRTLFCARDHFGVKPFFYARAGSTVILSNVLDCVRRHPLVTNDVDALAIADFLVYGYVLDVDRSSFKDIRRLPAGSSLSVGAGEVTPKRYWQLPHEGELRYRRRGEYVDHYLELFETAVRDRLRTDTVGVLMSGGLDSTAVAVMAHRALARSGRPFDLRAHTIVFDRIVPDEERRYSQLVADRAGVPIRHYPLDDYRFNPTESRSSLLPSPEPRSVFDLDWAAEVTRGPAAHARVLLRGDGGDPLISAGSAVEQQFVAGRYGYLLKEFLWLAWVRRQAPRIGVRSLVLGRMLGRRTTSESSGQPYPEWLAPELEREFALKDRWRALNAGVLARPADELENSYWPLYFESVDPAGMGMAAEFRYPFLDVRLARFLLRLPPIPWGAEKSLARIALRGLLPNAVVRRPKAPLAGNPWAPMLPAAESRWWEPLLQPVGEMHEFVDVPAAMSTLARVMPETQARREHDDIDLLRSSLRPVGLNLWFRQTACANFKTIDQLPGDR